ncbi:uncharacterized protein BCR38DRAFT_212032 [Pseudomassariella vexata]|uniref:Only prolin and serin are matching in the corresponding protein n=1 Tax=Pseudomassariella vexata TaxID=1141098 RepID=A0A1Y2DYH7_9PEZI|nr:uncharacterized protein BCR38DRAFT_212032 [Pseudomassariella vexata]ORY64321.1 hypothetical protein BCR38DRAFT_212032 [Pseudomassariella vexata]
MSPRLRPLQLPLLVEKRRKMEEAQAEIDSDHNSALYVMGSGSSDATSPATPTFSARGHLRYSSSTSSFDLTALSSPEGPSSPTPVKRILPDVQEESIDPLESDSDSDSDDAISDHFDLYDCLCAAPCIHGDTDLVQSTTDFYTHNGDIDYDMGFLSDNDFNTSPRSKKRRAGSESPFTGFTQRLNSRFPSLTRWKSTRNGSITSSPGSDFGFEQRPAVSRATSSRSSSRSASGRYPPDRTNEPPLPPTPASSFYESSDSIALPAPIDIEKANGFGPLIEMERALATTPLLPPLMTDAHAVSASVQPSPLESPTVVGPIVSEPQSPCISSPPLSTKPSNSSFHRVATSAELPNIPEPDEWSDRLGHANFTILPQPYKPENPDRDSLQQLRADWATARVNYTKHLVRTGEHYGITSKTYVMTEAKWAETDGAWRNHHASVVEAVTASGDGTASVKFKEGILTTVPRMDAEGKFPERGDEDIVGPMVREATMVSPGDSPEKRNPSFWRNLAGRVGLRK